MKCNYKDLWVIWDHNGTTCSFFTTTTITTAATTTTAAAAAAATATVLKWKLQSSQAMQTSVAFQSLNGLKQGATLFYRSFPALLEPFVIQIIVVNFNSLVQINFPENLNFSKFKSSH